MAIDNKPWLLFCAPFCMTFTNVSVQVVRLTSQPHSPVINYIRPRTIMDLLLRYIIHRLSGFEDILSEKSLLWFWPIFTARIHSPCSLSDDSTTASSQVSSPHIAICCFLFQFTVPALFLKVIEYLPSHSSSSSLASILLSIAPSIRYFRRQFLSKMLSIQLAFLLFIVCRIFLYLLAIRLLLFSHYWSNVSFSSFSSTTFQKFPGIFNLPSEMTKFQHHTKL